MQQGAQQLTEKDGAIQADRPIPQRVGSHPALVFVRIGANPVIGRTALYYRDDFSSHRTVAEIDALNFKPLSHEDASA